MKFQVLDLGLSEYLDALTWQKELHAKVVNLELDAALIFCRHFPVITLGRKASEASLKASKDEITGRRIKLFYVDRGGDVTYHGPGQLTVYPIINLRNFKQDLHWYLRTLESLVIACLRDFGLSAGRKEGLTGVWIADAKIAAIGVAVRQWVTYHGVTINVKKNDLDNFGLIHPCGMDIQVSSLEDFLKKEINIRDVQSSLLDKFNRMFKVGNITLGGRDGESSFAGVGGRD